MSWIKGVVVDEGCSGENFKVVAKLVLIGFQLQRSSKLNNNRFF